MRRFVRITMGRRTQTTTARQQGLASCRSSDGIQALLLAADRTWRRLNGYELLPLVAADVAFRDGARVERDDTTATKPNIKKGRAQKNEVEESDAA